MDNPITLQTRKDDPPQMSHAPTDDQDFAFHWGQFTKAVEILQRDFTDLKLTVTSKCQDCTYPKITQQLEKRVRYIEIKMAGIAGAAALAASILTRFI
jgi:hypothetical protein